ncbi:alpha/beta hydrolase [Nonomuraea mangrovi]|uniref:Alpha/beta hydrolase n=1 Tax=Nonomuraea mangrovi TaxID=2316207 RepID=A0ABW4T3Q0_9ACTN
MADHDAAQAAFGRVAALAAEHHADLDPAARLSRTHAWVGGGAPAFAAELAHRRSALQSALAAAVHALADLVVRQGGPHPPVPTLTSSITTVSAAPGGFHGIDPQAMTALTTCLDHGAHALTAAASRIAAELSAHGLPTHPGHTIGRIAAWAGTQTSDLRRRLAQIRRTVPGAMLPSGIAAYGLFGTHATDPAGAGALLSRIAAGENSAIARLLAVQEQAQDPGLAARVNAWWQALAAETREHFIDAAGAGLLNGLPATFRDQANRRMLAAEKTRLTRERDTATAELLRARDPLLLGTWERVAHRLRRIELIERELQPVPGNPPPLLLAFDLLGQGRLIVSWGDPDMAGTTVTSVSGLTSGLDAAHGDLHRSRALWQQAASSSGGRTVASITWLGYDAPQIDPGVFEPGTSVAFQHAATKGGAALAAFTDGLRASHQPSSTARSVIVGHSYGSLTTGHAALLRPGRLADDLIFVGSPGVGVDHAGRLGIDPAHVWVGEAGNDPVAALGRFGADPGHAAFGARRFPVERDLYTAAHSSYWNPMSVSLTNMARIINGQYDKIATPEPLNDRPELLMPELAPDLSSRFQR